MNLTCFISPCWYIRSCIVWVDLHLLLRVTEYSFKLTFCLSITNYWKPPNSHRISLAPLHCLIFGAWNWSFWTHRCVWLLAHDLGLLPMVFCLIFHLCRSARFAVIFEDMIHIYFSKVEAIIKSFFCRDRRSFGKTILTRTIWLMRFVSKAILSFSLHCCESPIWWKPTKSFPEYHKWEVGKLYLVHL